MARQFDGRWIFAYRPISAEERFSLTPTLGCGDNLITMKRFLIAYLKIHAPARLKKVQWLENSPFAHHYIAQAAD